MAAAPIDIVIIRVERGISRALTSSPLRLPRSFFYYFHWLVFGVSYGMVLDRIEEDENRTKKKKGGATRREHVLHGHRLGVHFLNVERVVLFSFRLVRSPR